ncbi:O-antigen ligase family protein [Mucilaginibacter sp. HMF5004]|uniref:O-antigen ligase family protein n=1 Tax=Mucilaginibacter rivuli TaxID=2857527 RepID=UPI001C5CFE36|nr:O-antigen ligase family protein [Mucilaginibacter rivuli]MBW4890158.1 O-antigen ligase family protein [Mucilaginibacter rivuli]
MKIFGLNTVYDPDGKNALLLIVGKLLLVMSLGTLCLAVYPSVVNMAALGCIALIFLNLLINEDYFAFVIIVFFSNHYIFGNDKGGLFNLAALLAMLGYNWFWKKAPLFKGKSTFGKLITFLIMVLIYCQMLSLLNNFRAETSSKIASMCIFLALTTLLFQMSKIRIREIDFIRFFQVLFLFTAFNLIVSLNQKYSFMPIQLALVPTWDRDAEFQYDIFRCTGTFFNFEAYAEYSLSMIILLLPGILSGSFKKIGTWFYSLAVGIIFMSVFAIVLSVTRSSFFLLPLAVIFIVISQFGRIKAKSVMPFLGVLAIGIALNMVVPVIDFSTFIERSKEMQISHLSDITSGSEINRGDIFAFAFKKIARTKGVIGEGYFTNQPDYSTVHFDIPHPIIGDYHNLYLGMVVFWGYGGAVSFTLLFIVTLFWGFTTYRKYKNKASPFKVDLLLGFNILFIFFLINQYKIIFLRESNYAVMIFILLIMYSSLIHEIKQEAIE